MVSIENYRDALRTQGTLLARIFMGALFLLAGINKLTGDGGVAEFSQYIPDMLPGALAVAWLVVLIEIIGGAALILGFHFYRAVGVLLIFTFLTIVLVHPKLQDPMFLKNAAIMGGLLYMLAYGQGDGWWLGRRRVSGKE